MNDKPRQEQLNEEALQQLLQVQPPAPDANTKAAHLAAALAAFAQDTATHQPTGAAAADGSVERGNGGENNQGTEKKSNILQGFLQRMRLTPDTNHQGNNAMTMNKTINTSLDSNNFQPRAFWQKPALVSGIAASSLAVLAGVVFIQYLGTNSYPGASPSPESFTLASPSPSADAAVEEILVTGARQEFAAESALASKSKKMAQRESVELGRTRNAYNAAQPALLAPAAPMADFAAQTPQEFRDRFSNLNENGVIAVTDNPVSTFSIDVDTAAYSYVRRQLNNGQLPPKDAVRSEELINYFDYHYPPPRDKNKPFTNTVRVVDSPWTPGNKLIHIGIQGYQLTAAEIPQSNLVFLLDVSGSMDEPSKLPLVKQSMGLVLDSLKPDDTVAIVVYAGAAGTVLEPTKAREKSKILAALNNLQAGGSTAGAEGIALAYQLAQANFNKDGVNRIILATDGDFNVGQTNDETLQDFVERKRGEGIYLSVLGFGMGNYQDALMQTLAQNGNGTAAYVDTLSEAQKVLVTEATSQLFPIAEDVKIQVEFNPNTVKEYRLIGYETRALQQQDFNNDKVDAGEVGAGQRVTAIYEITPAGAAGGLLEESRYQTLRNERQAQERQSSQNLDEEYAFLRLRYKLPGAKQSQLMETPITANVLHEENPLHQREVNFAIAVAGFAQLLKGSVYAGNFNYDKVIELAQVNKGSDEFGYRTEFVQLVRKAKIAQ